MTTRELLRSKKDQILKIAKKHGARNVRIFGSVARGDETPKSDVDFLIDMEPGRGLLAHAALLLDLEKLLGRHVDVATANGLRPRIREHVLSEAIPL